jgi:hypothetical protein
MDMPTFAFVARRVMRAHETYDQELARAERSSWHPDIVRHAAVARLEFEVEAAEFVRVLADLLRSEAAT